MKKAEIMRRGLKSRRKNKEEGRTGKRHKRWCGKEQGRKSVVMKAREHER